MEYKKAVAFREISKSLTRHSPFFLHPLNLSIIYKKERIRKDESGRLAGGDEKTGFPGWKAGQAGTASNKRNCTMPLYSTWEVMAERMV